MFNKGHGWIILNFIIPSNQVTIYLSDCFDPFPDLIKWLEDISLNRLPSAFIIDEEGKGKRLIAGPSNNQNDSFVFRIYEWDWGAEEHSEKEKLLLQFDITIFDFIENFTDNLLDFINQNKNLAWSSIYNISDFVFPLNRIKSNIKT